MGSRLLILGAAGSGTSTLARALADRLASQAFDADDFLWVPSDPPFRQTRPPAERLALMQAVFAPRSDWVLAGAICGWGDALIPRLTHVLFLSAPTETRIIRLRRRERQRHGAAIAPGGARAQEFRAFLDYASAYDDPAFAGRCRQQHEAWLAGLACPVIRLDGADPPALLADRAIAALDPAPPCA
ncbi:AAA family ATPase [Rhodovulum euryhalinum]|uniref:AAA domain-containing protein n=1 Tax=Rhodovulum euryhalinum TaxID=35805 RepID=A0A4R2KKI1_9RHOB|nr:AAA family ATPase [Rhodovulum euryhalinum]TCO72967.1 AAA domain-containing protein [Rhodovulum euryhalinum]